MYLRQSNELSHNPLFFLRYSPANPPQYFTSPSLPLDHQRTCQPTDFTGILTRLKNLIPSTLPSQTSLKPNPQYSTLQYSNNSSAASVYFGLPDTGGYSQRSNASRSAAPAIATSCVSGVTTVLSAGRFLKYSGFSRLWGWMDIFLSDRSARHQSMFL